MGNSPIPEPVDVSEGELIAELQAAAEVMGKPPSARDMRAMGNYSDRIYDRVFGSWNEALKAAKLPVNQPRNACVRVTKRDFEREVDRVAHKIGHAPSTQEFNKHTNWSYTPYKRWWDEWADMLVDLGYIEAVD